MATLIYQLREKLGIKNKLIANAMTISMALVATSFLLSMGEASDLLFISLFALLTGILAYASILTLIKRPEPAPQYVRVRIKAHTRRHLR